MKILKVVGADALKEEDVLIGLIGKPTPIWVKGVFNTGHGRVQVTLSSGETIWLNATDDVVVAVEQ